MVHGRFERLDGELEAVAQADISEIRQLPELLDDSLLADQRQRLFAALLPHSDQERRGGEKMVGKRGSGVDRVDQVSRRGVAPDLKQGGISADEQDPPFLLDPSPKV